MAAPSPPPFPPATAVGATRASIPTGAVGIHPSPPPGGPRRAEGGVGEEMALTHFLSWIPRPLGGTTTRASGREVVPLLRGSSVWSSESSSARPPPLTTPRACIRVGGRVKESTTRDFCGVGGDWTWGCGDRGNVGGVVDCVMEVRLISGYRRRHEILLGSETALEAREGGEEAAGGKQSAHPAAPRAAQDQLGGPEDSQGSRRRAEEKAGIVQHGAERADSRVNV